MRPLIIKLLKWLLDIMEKPTATSPTGEYLAARQLRTPIIEPVVREVNAEVTEDNDHENETML